jgi:hypothetical protein
MTSLGGTRCSTALMVVTMTRAFGIARQHRQGRQAAAFNVGLGRNPVIGKQSQAGKAAPSSAALKKRSARSTASA